MSSESSPLTADDIEAAFLLALPLIHLPEEMSGHCQLEVRPSPGLATEPTGVLVVLDEGQVASCSPGLEAQAPVRVSGTALDWFEAIKGGELDRLDFGLGDLGEGLVRGISVAFGGRERASA